MLAKQNMNFTYQVYVGNNPKAAAAEMDADVRGTIRSVSRNNRTAPPTEFLRQNDTFLGPWKDHIKKMNLKEIPASGIMSQVVEDYMVDSYKKQGFYNSEHRMQALITLLRLN
jgi:hypothetical protein